MSVSVCLSVCVCHHQHQHHHALSLSLPFTHASTCTHTRIFVSLALVCAPCVCLCMLVHRREDNDSKEPNQTKTSAFVQSEMKMKKQGSKQLATTKGCVITGQVDWLIWSDLYALCDRTVHVCVWKHFDVSAQGGRRLKKWARATCTKIVRLSENFWDFFESTARTRECDHETRSNILKDVYCVRHIHAIHWSVAWHWKP